MKDKTNWKLFFVLLAACVVTTAFVFPYQMALSPAIAKAFTPVLAVAALVQSAVFFSIILFFGLKLSKRFGFGLPVLEGALKGEPQGTRLKSILGLSVGVGVLSGVLIILLSIPFPDVSISFLKAEMSVAIWKRILASFYGGIAEEILCRLFLVSLIVWAISKIKKMPEGQPARWAVWLSIVVSAVLFGLGHLGITASMTAITPAVVTRAILLNGVPGVMFGWLFWKKGLESAIIAHFSADIVIHVLTPLVATWLIH